MRRFELSEGSASKFWEISLDGAAFTVTYGRLGTDGRTQTKEFRDAAEASAAAEKLIREKLGKGYSEVKQGAASKPKAKPAASKPAASKPAASKPAASKPAASKPAAAKTAASKPAAAKKTAAKAATKQAKPAAPDFKLSSGKAMGARAQANAAERFLAATTGEAWSAAAEKVSYSSYDVERLLAHLIEHELFTPRSRLHVRGCTKALMRTPVESVLNLLSQLEEQWVATVPTDTPVILSYFPLLVRLMREAPEALAQATLPKTLARATALVRALSGEQLDPALGAQAVSMVSEMLPYGSERISWLDEDDSPVPVEPARLLAAMELIGGPRWIREFPNPDRLPAEVATPALEGETLEEVGRALSIFNPAILDPRKEPPARFFEVAEKMEEQTAAMMRVAGIRKAKKPKDIPAKAEYLLHPRDVNADPGFGQLGTARLDAWAEHWLSRYPNALTIGELGVEPTDDEFEAHDVGVFLRRLVFAGVPFSDPLRRRLIGTPRPYKHNPDELDVRGFVSDVGWLGGTGARSLLPLLADMARTQTDENCALGLRLVVALVLRGWDGDQQIPEEIDELLSLGDPVDYDSGVAVREAIAALPIERAERVIFRTANQLDDPYEELTYAREGISAVALRRFARLVAGGRENEDMWSHLGSGSLEVLGAEFGPVLAEALSGETLSESFMERIADAIHEDAFAQLEEAVGKHTLDLKAELDGLVKEFGDATVVYALSAGSAGKGLARVGGLPAGFTAEDVPRYRGRKLVHAFTVDLRSVPELAARYPDARTISVWIQGYSEDPQRAQKLIPRTDAEIAQAAAVGGTELELLRLEVPAVVFDRDPPGRAAYARRLLYAKPGFLLGGPLWLQTGPPGVDPEFIAQYDERLAHGANFGDAGICYSFVERCEWQCH
ncbi:MAG: WGR domain-containing protein [Polyangiaceae bacterium]